MGTVLFFCFSVNLLVVYYFSGGTQAQAGEAGFSEA